MEPGPYFYKVARAQYDLIDSTLRKRLLQADSFTTDVEIDATRRLVAYLLQRSVARVIFFPDIKLNQLLKIKVTSRKLRMDFRGERWRLLIAPRPKEGLWDRPSLPSVHAHLNPEADWIEVFMANPKKGLPRRFRLNVRVIQRFIEAIPTDLAQLKRAGTVDLYSGRPAGRTERSRLVDANRNPYPELIRGALQQLRACRFNADAIAQHLQRRRENRHAGRLERRRYYVDLACYWGIFSQNPAHVERNIWQYRPAYRVSSTGRITQIQGGLQGASRAMKAAAYSGVDGLYNYDVQSSQVWGFLHYATRAGISADNTLAYAETPNAKNEYSRLVGIDEETWKRCLYATFFGSVLTVPPSTGSAVYQVLSSHVGQESIRSSYGRLYEVLRPIVDELDVWREYLISDYAEANGVRTRHGLHIYNATGLSFNLDKVKRRDDRRKRAAAFMLQGLEAAYIHALTVALPHFGVVPMSNEHDGLVTLGEIPEAAMQEAAERSGFVEARLVPKPFATAESM